MFTLKSFYKSKEWLDLLQVLKLERLVQDKLICEHCGREIIKAYDCIGHHVVELNETNVNDYSISLNPNNIKLIHFKCHNLIHQRFEGFRQRVFIVYGSPCSGKTTWVNGVAFDDDLIVDIDSIWECICKADRYNKPNRLKSVAFGVRDNLLDMIKCRRGMWRNAYVIGTYPLASDRERLADRLGAELVFIDETKEECLSRCVNEKWKEFVEEWFDLYTE